MGIKAVPAWASNGGIKKIFNRKADGTYEAKPASVDVEALETGISAAAAKGLPAVTSSNNGKLLQVKSGKWEMINGIPEVTSSDNSKFAIVSSGKWAKSGKTIKDWFSQTGSGDVTMEVDYDYVKCGNCEYRISNLGIVEAWGNIEVTPASSTQLGNGWYYFYTPYFYLPDALSSMTEQTSNVAMLMKGHGVGFISSENHDAPITDTPHRLQYLVITYGGGSGTLTKYTISFHVFGKKA